MTARVTSSLICGCDAPYYALGLCARHYRESRRRKQGLPKRQEKTLTGCSEIGCSRAYHARGLCQLHYQRHKRALAWRQLPYFRNPLVPQIEQLAETMSQAKIAKLLKVTRNVVIGIVNRARVAGRLLTPNEMAIPDYVPPRGFPLPGSCLWMDGDPRDPLAHFCGEPVRMPGEAWCTTHRRRVYLPLRIANNEAAD